MPRGYAIAPRTGSKEILDHIAEKSGIDDAVYAAFGNEIDDAKK